MRLGSTVLTAAVLAALAVCAWPARGSRGSADAAGRFEPVGSSASGGSWWRWHARVSDRVLRRHRPPWVADLAEVTAVGLAAGLDLPSAVSVAARSPGIEAAAPWLGPRIVASASSGGAVLVLEPEPDALSSQDRHDLRVLEAAWRLTEEAGAASSVVTAAAAESIRARRAAGDRAGVVAAGPRASMWLLSALPVAGPLAALLVGLTPGRLYGTGPAQAAAAVGLLLTALGWSWSRGLLRRALRAGRTDGSVG
ncbi:hypothetical protein GCM10023153_05870 [Ornithinibacter aureus]|uniref:Type II secretion system protein GspF domain-containing protein n=1 Tax=Ornithinibacter aureus TaxID=622664 RepID=A0ABP8JEE5_9MICO|nr:hypothetical protein C8E84_1870 [Ornithinibacter aureus]